MRHDPMYEVPLSRLNELTDASRELVALRGALPTREEAVALLQCMDTASRRRWRRLYDTPQLRAKLAAIALGLPDEEGQNDLGDDGAAPPPRPLVKAEVLAVAEVLARDTPRNWRRRAEDVIRVLDTCRSVRDVTGEGSGDAQAVRS